MKKITEIQRQNCSTPFTHRSFSFLPKLHLQYLNRILHLESDSIPVFLVPPAIYNDDWQPLQPFRITPIDWISLRLFIPHHPLLSFIVLPTAPVNQNAFTHSILHPSWEFAWRCITSTLCHWVKASDVVQLDANKTQVCPFQLKIHVGWVTKIFK